MYNFLAATLQLSAVKLLPMEEGCGCSPLSRLPSSKHLDGLSLVAAAVCFLRT